MKDVEEKVMEAGSEKLGKLVWGDDRVKESNKKEN